MRTAFILLYYEATWFIAVIGAGHGHAWPGLAASALLVLGCLACSGQRVLELCWLGVALVLGVLLDGAAAKNGLIRYAAATPALPPSGAPLWILGLWAAFASSLPSVAWLRGRIAWGALLGALGAPLSYLTAARAWHALSLSAPAWHALVCLACGWAVALALLLHLRERWFPAATDGPHPLAAHDRRSAP